MLLILIVPRPCVKASLDGIQLITRCAGMHDKLLGTHIGIMPPG